ncbi:MAG: glucose 1-dehydrogenase [Bacteroidota bacterium]|nr:glucose 1-dehydrogenase [Bacteroidota bacterium]
MKDLEDKIAIVTGASSGIGRATALLFASEGARVVVSDIDAEGGNETVSQIKAQGGEAILILADTSKSTDHQALVEQTVNHYGGLHITCNNAGIGGYVAPTGEYPIDSWDRLISINLSGVFYGMCYQIPAMLESGGGSIVNMASILGSVGTKGSPAYVAAKHGVVGLTKTTALEYADKKIRVNSVGPGYIVTPLLTKTLDNATLDGLAKLHPMGRLGTAEEVAELVLWLSSSKSSFVTGSYYTIDGGYTAQ